MKNFLKRYWHWILVTLLFVALVFFVADVTVTKLISTKMTVGRLNSEIEQYQQQITSDSLFLEGLKDDAMLEKFAREKFYMHAEGEEVFIFK